MYDYIIGHITSMTKETITLEVNGIGYRVYVPADMTRTLHGNSGIVKIFTSFVVRELSHTLYGFLTSQTRDLFEALLHVSGVGPKLALSIVGAMCSQDLINAVYEKNTVALCKIPGIGKKTAERLLIELKDSLSALHGAYTIPMGPSSFERDIISTLINLGYTVQTAQGAAKRVLEKHKDEKELANLIAFSLQEV